MFTYCTTTEERQLSSDSLDVTFEGDAKIEVGGPYVGIEMHHSSPLLQRISFFYPAANSMDLSTDFWKRDTSFIMSLGLKIGEGDKEKIGLEPFKFDLTPYSVTFHKSDEFKAIDISYKFLKDKPAMVIRYELTNVQDEEKDFEFYTHLETALRTCHTYNFIHNAWTDYDENSSGIYANFDNPETQFAQIFIINAGEKPTSFNSESYLQGVTNPSTEWWYSEEPELNNSLISKDNTGRPAAKFLYKKTLKPNEKMTIVQIVGSCKQKEGKEISEYLLNNYKKEISSYEQSVLKKVFGETKLTSGDSIIDQSVFWAKAILEANAHYLDGEIVPMPCPAEYNFYFTHDVLKTDLAAVNFDIERVKRDLDYIIRHANEDKIIPHAYYWKDSLYLTEYADHDNWNNFWFTIVSGSYLRHSADVEFLKVLYPYITKSLDQALRTKGDDDLMWSNRPDWWDIGKLYGSKSYMTILAIKAIREYLFISTVLETNLDRIVDYDLLANRMQDQLNTNLWDDNLNYLINYYEPGKIDKHYYIGSLLAAHYGLLDKTKLSELVKTAKEKLLDEKVGIYNVFPMDFHVLRDYLNFSGNEAGDEFYYANGGIWPHGNAWYALALISDEQKDEALNFIKKVMTVKGIMEGPNGQPAMYEVRNGNFNDPSIYGTVDKPQFLWAAGWYLYSLYHLYAINENSWNISFDPYLGGDQEKSSFDLFAAGKLLNVSVVGKGDFIKHIKYGREIYPSAVIPEEIPLTSNVSIELGKPESPYLASTNSILLSSTFNSKTLTIRLKAFKGHKNVSKIFSPFKPKKVNISGRDNNESLSIKELSGIYEIEVNFSHNFKQEEIILEFF
jgi:glycogen debranching enzyme